MLVRLKLHAIAAKHDGHDKHLADVQLLLRSSQPATGSDADFASPNAR
jgi:hypothetical protein